jgi:hypothetical protein
VKRLHRLWNRIFHPQVEPDPRLVDAMDRMDEAAREFELVVREASKHGVFGTLQDAIRRNSLEDGERIRRARRRGS